MSSETNFHCSASWHITNGLAFRIYELAYMVAKKSGTFFASGRQLAEYFRCSKSSVYRALDCLADLGFFVLVERGFFESNTYKVVSHKQWAKNRSNECVKKLEYLWSGEGDLLGQDLYALSGGRVKFL